MPRQQNHYPRPTSNGVSPYPDNVRQLDRTSALGHRLVVNGLVGPRLPRTRLVEAARPGLQDGSPRSALLSMAARVEKTEPDDWRHPDLAQVFGARGAIYVVPRTDIGVFTKGLLPRDPDRIVELERMQHRVQRLLNGSPMRQADLVTALPELGGTRGLRWVGTLGSIVPLWDTIDTIVQPHPTPEIDAEDARRELARRFFRHLGPATAGDLQWWLDGSRADAAATTASIEDDLEEVLVDGRPCLMTAPIGDVRPDPDALHLLPPDDTYINRRARNILLPDPARQKLLWPQAPPPGALVIAGEIAGTWRRRGKAVEITRWRRITATQRKAAEQIAAEWPLENGPATVSWADLR